MAFFAKILNGSQLLFIQLTAMPQKKKKKQQQKQKQNKTKNFQIIKLNEQLPN